VRGYGFDGHRLVAVSAPGGRGGAPEEKRGPGWAGYRVCSIRKAWAFSGWVVAAALMPRRARAALASQAVRAPRIGATWSRYSVTAL